MSTRTEREELSKQLKLNYTDKSANREKLAALQIQLSALAKVTKISHHSGLPLEIIGKPLIVGKLFEDICSLVKREFELTEESAVIEKKLLDQ